MVDTPSKTLAATGAVVWPLPHSDRIGSAAPVPEFLSQPPVLVHAALIVFVRAKHSPVILG
jgi:hypothetical protein